MSQPGLAGAAVLDSSVVPAPRPTADVWRAPLVPAAVALTAGIVLDRLLPLSLEFCLAGVAVSVLAWAATRGPGWTGLSLVYLMLAVAALGAAYHHWHVAVYAADDIGELARPEPRPARLRGELVEEPVVSRHAHDDPLQSFDRPDLTVTVLQVRARKQDDDWLSASGRVRLIVSEPLADLHVGDRVEVVGRLVSPPGPANPGEADYAALLRDQRIRAMLLVRGTAEGVRLTERGWPWTPSGWLAMARGWAQRQLAHALPPEQVGVATALLLGDGAPMTRDNWDKYVRTGVLHVLAVSGQHLVVLGAFFWLVLRLLGVRRRRGAAFVAVLLSAYALLAGARAPVLRAAVMVAVYCFGLMLRRPVLAGNTFAAAWLAVVALNPTDVFSAGCQFSFLAVAVLYWGTSRWVGSQPDAMFGSQPSPLDKLVDASRPAWERNLRWLGRRLVFSVAVTALVWLALAPLQAARYHTVSPVAVLIGPPLVLLTSIALIAGFLLLLAAAVCAPLVPLFAGVVHISLAWGETLVNLGNRPWLIRYVGDIPDWWLWVFYLGLLAFLLLDGLQRHWRAVVLAGFAWVCVGLVAASARPVSDEMRCTFLAVGHGGCVVIETSEGRTLLYDAGSLAGPDVTRRQIAPFLWNRGVRRIDEIFVSHADLDHFNGINGLLERFAVGQVTHTPTFPDRQIQPVRATLDALERRGVPRRVVRAGDRLTSGSVTIDVLHPPEHGPDGPENARSLVLLVRHAGHTILLTGDLEKNGLDRVLRLPSPPVDVLMSPHHGSRAANTPGLADWARPRAVVSCQGPPRGRAADPYSGRGITLLGTWPHGAVTIRSSRAGLTVETFVSRERHVLRGVGS